MRRERCDEQRIAYFGDFVGLLLTFHESCIHETDVGERLNFHVKVIVNYSLGLNLFECIFHAVKEPFKQPKNVFMQLGIIYWIPEHMQKIVPLIYRPIEYEPVLLNTLRQL